MSSKYVDTSANMQVIGDVFINPSLLDLEDKYKFNEADFPQEFHRILFGSIYNLHQLGAKQISIEDIEKYLEQRPKKYAIYKLNKGSEYLENIREMCQLAAFDYYYNRMKKMTLLRMYNNNVGMDLSWLYDPDNILDVKKKEAQETWFDNTPIDEIANTINDKIDEIKAKYVDNSEDGVIQAGDGALALLERLKTTPEIGYPLYGRLVNAIHRGARLKKFYLRSAATGVGKTRSMIADACNIACNKIYNLETKQWENNGTREPTQFITTEQEEDEIQTMMIAFLSGVNEDHILENEYVGDEWERVVEAAAILSKSPLYIKKLPDFSLQDIENTIKFGIRQYNVRYIFMDYIHSSMKILSEISSKAGVKGLREDNILFMISVRLKDLCNQYGVFIMSATQLNADYVSAQQYDQNLLRGAKAIADKIDCGMIMLQTSQDDRESLKNIVNSMGIDMPDIKISVYKNRRGRYKDILLWCKSDRGTCRIDPMFVTRYNYELVEMQDFKIKITPRIEASAF
jgi:replicative DNA helicase